MAVYNGRLYESDPEGLVIKGDVLTSYSQYSLPGDISTITSTEKRELFTPIYFEGSSVNVSLMLNMIQEAINLMSLIPVQNSANIGLDEKHISVAPEDSTIKQGVKRGIKTIIRTQRVG